MWLKEQTDESCRLGQLDGLCAFASPASQVSAGKHGFAPLSAHYRSLIHHETAEVLVTLQNLPHKATVVIGMGALTTACLSNFAV